MGVRSRSGSRLRSLVAVAVEPRFDALDARLDQIAEVVRVAGTEYPSTRVEHDLFALRQQMEEVLDVVRSQHARIRALEEALERPRTAHS